MTRLSQLLHLDEAPPVEPLRPVPATTRRPLRIDEQARSIAALAGIRSEAPVLDLRVANGLGMRRPAAPKRPHPNRRSYSMLVASRATISTLVQAYNDVADELESALAELGELAPFAANAGC